MLISNHVSSGVFVGEMAGSVLDSGGGRDELKTQFMTREGTYHLMTLAGLKRSMIIILDILHMCLQLTA